MFSRWITESGDSRTTKTSLRPSAIVTSAARTIRFSKCPLAIAASVFMLHGATSIPSVANEPWAIGAARSSSS
jgi:hypothetical protein